MRPLLDEWTFNFFKHLASDCFFECLAKHFKDFKNVWLKIQMNFKCLAKRLKEFLNVILLNVWQTFKSSFKCVGER